MQIFRMYGSDAGQPARSLYTKGLPPLCDSLDIHIFHGQLEHAEENRCNHILVEIVISNITQCSIHCIGIGCAAISDLVQESH